MMNLRPFLILFSVFLISACTETQLVSHVAKTALPGPTGKSEGDFKVGKPYQVAGKTYIPQETYNFTETGIASWYGADFHGKKTANGEIYDMNELTAAHKTLQLPSLVRVTNLENGRSIILRVNDRGPFKRGRILDVSKRAAELLGFKNKGVAKIKLQVLSNESRAIAEAAKRGEDTRGVEVAMNENRLARSQGLSPPKAVTLEAPRVPPAELETASYKPTQPPPLAAQDITGHMRDGNFMPDPVVKQLPVSPTNIFVQAGSFGNQENALSLAESLKSFGNARVYPAMVNGRQFYRVRIGPLHDVNGADMLLANMISAGRSEAIIVVD